MRQSNNNNDHSLESNQKLINYKGYSVYTHENFLLNETSVSFDVIGNPERLMTFPLKCVLFLAYRCLFLLGFFFSSQHTHIIYTHEDEVGMCPIIL